MNNGFKEKYNIKTIQQHVGEIRKHRGKYIKHHKYVIILNDDSEIDVFIPHYFELVGIQRKFIEALRKDILIKRIKKINKIKICITKK